MLLLGFTLCFFLSTAVAREDDRKPMYTITAPNTIASRSFYTVEVFIHHAHRQVNVTVELQKPLEGVGLFHNFEPLSSTIRPGDGKSFRFKTKLLKSDAYTLHVMGNQGLKFEESMVIPVNPKKATVLIQTDKGLYQAGQTVNFRIVTLDTQLMPLPSNLHVNIYDGRNNLIKQWTHSTTQKGVFSDSLELSTNPVLGTWKIEVVNEDTVTTVQTFSVHEYILPTFEVTVRTQPTFITYNQSDVLVIVDARYTFGQAVKGKVSLHIRDEYCTYNFVELCDAKIYKSELTNIVDEASVAVNFVRDLELPQNIYGHGFRNFKIEAVVVEQLTQISRNETTVITMHSDAIKVELVPAGSFKPGLNFTQLIKIVYHDDTPLLNGDGAISVTVQFSSAPQDSVSYSIPMTPTGIIRLEIPVSKKATSLTFQAKYKDITGYASVPRSASTGNFEYIKLNQLTRVAEVEKYMKLEIESTRNLESRLILLVVARGDINYVKTFPPSDHPSQIVQFKVHETMAPVMTVFVYYVSGCGNLVVDAISIEVEGLFRTPVSIKLKHNTTEPGKEVVLEIKTRPKSFIGILAVDQSVLLLNKGNDITEQKILDDMAQYEMSRSYFYNPLIVDKNNAFPHPWSSATTPLQVFRDGGLIIKTNFLEDVDNFAIPYVAGVPMDKTVIDNMANLQEDTPTEEGRVTEGTTYVRKSFPETFLWIDAETNSAGKYTLHKKAPDSTTSYIVSAIAINEKTGFGIAYPTKMTVFKKFFTTLSLPLSIHRGEFVSIQMLTFNYYDHVVKGTVTMHNENHDFKFVVDNKEVEDTSKHALVNIPAKDGVVSTFIISPKKLGYINLTVSSTCKFGADSLVKKLLVKAEGAEHSVNKPFLIDLSGSTHQFSISFTVEYPIDTVENSQTLSVSVTGNALGTTIQNFDKLLSLPQGCGEQSMVNFAPDVVIGQFFVAIGKFPEDIHKKVINYLQKGYQTQLTYHRTDGAFSAFGNTDVIGSTWLTAFIAKYFYLAGNFTNIDQNVLESALEFLSKQQTREGSFAEGGNVIYKAMQGGSSEGVSLTAYVLITFIQIKNPKYRLNIKTATEHLEKQSDKIPNMGLYDLIITTYALHFANSDKKDIFLKAVSDKAISNNSQTHWDIPEDPQKPTISKSLSIEATAYVCLTYLLRNELELALPIIKWLISQQGVNGGFESTQDTVIAIEALGIAAAKLFSKPGSTMTITVTAGTAVQTFTVDSTNSLLFQISELPVHSKLVTITATGTGVAVLQVSYTYNVYHAPNKPQPSESEFTGSVKTTPSDQNNRNFDVVVCTKKRETTIANNMVVMEVGMASGTVVNKCSLPSAVVSNDVNTIKKIETIRADTRVVVYFNVITEMCVSIPAIQTHLVSNSKPADVKVYDYYEAGKCGEMTYNAPEVKLVN